MSNGFKKVAGVLGITLKHATTKHAQTTGLVEQPHASVKRALKLEAGKWRSLWHKYVSIRSLITTHLITRVLAVNQAECFMDTILIISLI